MAYPSIDTHVSGDINSRVEDSQNGNDTLGAALVSIRITISVGKDAPSGSQIKLLSSSKEENLAWREDAATRRDVEGSKTTFEYGLGFEMVREGRWSSSCTSGIHSTKVGP